MHNFQKCTGNQKCNIHLQMASEQAAGFYLCTNSQRCSPAAAQVWHTGEAEMFALLITGFSWPEQSVRAAAELCGDSQLFVTAHLHGQPESFHWVLPVC